VTNVFFTRFSISLIFRVPGTLLWVKIGRLDKNTADGPYLAAFPPMFEKLVDFLLKIIGPTGSLARSHQLQKVADSGFWFVFVCLRLKLISA